MASTFWHGHMHVLLFALLHVLYGQGDNVADTFTTIILARFSYPCTYMQSASSTSAEELVQLLNPDRRSQDLAQSGVISDDMLAKILDRSHLTVAAASSGKLHQTQPRSQGTTKSRKRSSTASGKAVDAGALTEGASGSKGPVMPPYPLMGVGYEVVLDEPSRATGLLPSIEDQ